MALRRFPTYVNTNEEWRANASCKDLPKNLFHPVGQADTSYAMAVCTRCPVKEECLQYAQDNKIDFGIWGGVTEEERSRRPRRKAANDV